MDLHNAFLQPAIVEAQGGAFNADMVEVWLHACR
jgi:hypothetical protein